MEVLVASRIVRSDSIGPCGLRASPTTCEFGVVKWPPALATMVGAKPPRRVPVWLARLVAGQHTVAMMTECRAGMNAKAKRDLPWRPKHSSWRQGFADVLTLIWPVLVKRRAGFSRVVRADVIRSSSVDQITAEGERDARADCCDDGSC